MKLKMMSGKQTVYLYEGVIPRSGKQVFEFDGVKLCHRSVKADKCDLLVHVDTGIIVRSYLFGKDRSVLLNDIANNIDSLKHFISNPEQFNIQTRPKVSRTKEEQPMKYLDLSKEQSCITNNSKVKRSFNLKDSKW